MPPAVKAMLDFSANGARGWRPMLDRGRRHPVAAGLRASCVRDLRLRQRRHPDRGLQRHRRHHGRDDYFGLIKTVAVTGVLVAAFRRPVHAGRFHGWGWLMGLPVHLLRPLRPEGDVVIVDKLGGQPPVVVGNVPIGVAFFGHATSLVGDVMTRFFETAFQVIRPTNAQLPSELAYQKNGVMFGNRLIQASRAANIADPQLRTDLIAFVYNCTIYDLQDGTIDPAAFPRAPTSGR